MAMAAAAAANLAGRNMVFKFMATIKNKNLGDYIVENDQQTQQAFFEDDDYAIRTYYQGYKVGYINTSFVYHNHATTSKHLPEKDALMARNRKYFFEKHPIAEYIWTNRRSSLPKDIIKYIEDSFY